VSLLEVTALAIHRERRVVVHDVTFSVSRGERVAIMGASGTGKSTVLRAIAGLEPLDAGTIVIDGATVDPSATRDHVRALQQRVGMVFQFHHLFAHMSALQNVALALVHVRRLPVTDAEREARTLLERLGVAPRALALPHELSGGEAQRVAIARALAMRPPLLLLDEPTASLDPRRRGELAATLTQLSADGTALVIATHDPEFARTCSQRVLLMDEGRIVRDGRPGDVLS
jgi:ABC-type polar amino acid transport system ATPase subunit